jgi:hypothetical protein
MKSWTHSGRRSGERRLDGGLILTPTTLLHFSDQDESTATGTEAKISAPAGTQPSMHEVPMPQ